MKGYVKNINQGFAIDGVALSGVSSVNAGYSIPSIEPLAVGSVFEPEQIQRGAGEGRFSFSRSMITVDEHITKMIGRNKGFDGQLSYNSKKINFTSGYLSSYQCSFNIDQLPQSNIEILSFGDFGPDAKIQNKKDVTQELFIPLSSGISLNCDGRETNRVLGFSMDISCQLTPVYKIGSMYPCEVIIQKPIQQIFSVDLEVDDYETKNIHDYITKGFQKKDITIGLKNKCGTVNKVEYTFNNCYLMSENVTTDAEDTTRISLQYKSLTMGQPNFKYL